MKVFLAGTSVLDKHKPDVLRCKYVLESFYSIKRWQIPLIKSCDMFLLDSGAFTFLNSKKTQDFDEYLKTYIDFIKKYDVKFFFELDVDQLVGYQKVKQMRARLEKETGKKCIPVWHKSRGKEEFLKLCDEYNYIAIGGIAIKTINKKDYKYLPWFIQEAHKRNCKVHGLGFTNTQLLRKIKFDSVDSTTWLVGRKFGELTMFENGNIVRKRFFGKRCIDGDGLLFRNFEEWLKF